MCGDEDKIGEGIRIPEARTAVGHRRGGRQDGEMPSLEAGSR